jgi:hypothetical protein
MQSIISSNDSLEEYQRKMAHNRRVRAQAQAILRRAKKAGIPEKFMRINQKTFESLLDNEYHKDVSKMADYVYKNPMGLISKEFVVIDGGGIIERKKAGFAILFRLIACDRCGLYKNGTELAHQLQSLRSDAGINRNDITEYLRDADLLFISECVNGDFKKGFDTGRFFDEILSYRDDHIKTTIISFSNPLPKSSNFETPDNVMTEQVQFGQYMCSITQADETKDNRFFRIRVKKDGRK